MPKAVVATTLAQRPLIAITDELTGALLAQAGHPSARALQPLQQLPEHLRNLRGSPLAAYFAGLPYQDLPPTSEDYAPLPF